MSAELRTEVTRLEEVTRTEVEVRKLVQRMLDDRNIKIATYLTQSTPPPWWHQQVAWHWAMRVAVIYLALKPGLGKTRIGADVIRGKIDGGYVRSPKQVWLEQRYSTAFPDKVLPPRWGIKGGVLITCPRVVLGEWKEQLLKWQNITATTITGDVKRKMYRSGVPSWVHICAYDSLEAVEHNEYDLIIGDEAHYIANDESNRFARMMSLRRTAVGAVALSGTPLPNMLQSLWSQYYWLDGGRTLGPSQEAYRKRYFNTSGRSVTAKDDAETRVGQAISRITMNMTMQEAFPGKPQKITEVIRVPMTKEQHSYYEQVRKQQAADIMAGTVTAGQALLKIGKLMQITQGFVFDDDRIVQQFSSAKLKALEGMLTGDGDFTDRKVIVWCRFKPEVEMVTKMLERHKVTPLVLKGAQSDKDREVLKKEWNNNPEPRVLVGMISMGIGLNLNAPMCVTADGKPRRCSTTVFYGLDWKPTQLEQAMDRVYRGDQVETCLYRFLLSDDLDEEDDNGDAIKPIDVRVYESLLAKMEQGERVAEESDAYVRMLLGA
jgi:SNF2 family DNA or RNA helicase